MVAAGSRLISDFRNFKFRRSCLTHVPQSVAVDAGRKHGRAFTPHVKSSLITSQGVNQVIPLGHCFGGEGLGTAWYFHSHPGSLFRKLFQVPFLVSIGGKFASIWMASVRSDWDVGRPFLEMAEQEQVNRLGGPQAVSQNLENFFLAPLHLR
jgi:hypothetical protein